MIVLLLAAALAIVFAAAGVVWAGLCPPADVPPARLHHTVTCSCPRGLEGAYA
ncbi:MAG: hypothetical protein ACRDP6_37215 [Actinoallomurus sp.]